VSQIIQCCAANHVPFTFRAAGTSLSGQSVSDSVLIVAGKHWENYHISDDHNTITMQPGLIGGRVNRILKPMGRLFSPDPASINSSMVGGIVVNN
jgi:D-lactate dehydrogenase